ncbi:UV-damage endonuclease [Exophiala xenobiotica]|uniref:UV-damage endonuclease n=1 Tax=Vermiconidia calcicola TaxID=1690605 RepID=A0AAV9QFK8_9PEZI|nr:UV-damage endonuclease [Exophiala xenobiotica]KAK5539713.1 UV-damage endonuclease [Vermiconidia calcicola]KAK5541774.1 UV-damage endonuclease [Chaetothyriales sp. CCFEE 6169]KAK5274857.1 UV-damage endonuclease [Exophiala xenobiotica]KAK5303977.1 UV-damage endonuclease [Exophiala xenobiotica]
MAKRKRSSLPDADTTVLTPKTLPVNVASVDSNMMPPQPVRRTSSRRASTQVPPADIDTNPVTNDKIKDGKDALRASPDAEEPGAGRKKRKTAVTKVKKETEDVEVEEPAKPVMPATPIKKAVKHDDVDREDPEAEGEEDADPEELKEALSRPPPVNSSYLPLPWKGRIGYACLNTYLRASNPPVFTSRTCRIASILEHRHPLKDPTQPEHATKNRPDKDQSADVARGQAYVEALGLANARDIPKMLRWNDRYGIKFMRLSSEMFPFASHDVYGYKLAPFASEALSKAGRVAAELGHRLTTHPGQFTQLGSPRKEVITASIRDLDYHCELLGLLKLPEQQDRDAVMILHMGGVFGDKAATIERFKENYHKLPQKVKDRLVLENDDVCYSVHDLLPVCEELNIPLVLDYHHHNIVFDADKIREGTLDIMDLYPRIKATWTKKGITQKMHYSEPTPSAITGRQRRKHNPRVATLPPCAADMDLMIEAKDKEQAVFELMRTFKLPGFDTFNDIVPYTRNDENKPWKAPKKPKKAPKKKKSKAAEEEAEEEVEDAEPEAQPPPVIPDEEVGMGGPEGRVYWPPGMEEWLRPKKREVKARDPEKAKTTAERAAARRAEKAAWQAAQEAGNAAAVTDTPASASASASKIADGDPGLNLEKTKSVYNMAKPKKPARAPPSGGKKKSAKSVPTPSESELSELSEEGTEQDVDMSDMTDAEEIAAPVAKGKRSAPTRATNGRSVKRKAVNYAEGDED